MGPAEAVVNFLRRPKGDMQEKPPGDARAAQPLQPSPVLLTKNYRFFPGPSPETSAEASMGFRLSALRFAF
jgi:hypothetical protein